MWLTAGQECHFTRSPITDSSLRGILDQNNLFLLPPRHLSFARTREHIHLAAHAELRQINSWLDGETRIGQDLAFVFGFEIIDVGAVPMNRAADAVTCTMHELFAIAFPVNELAHRLVHLPTGDFPRIGKGLADSLAT